MRAMCCLFFLSILNLGVASAQDVAALNPVRTFDAQEFALDSDGESVGFAGQVFFTTSAQETGRELWVSDGTEAGTRLFADIYPGPGSGSPSELKVIGEHLFFRALTTDGVAVFASDGANLSRLTAPSVSAIGSLIEYRGRLHFSDSGVLYTSDGTPEGTGSMCIQLNLTSGTCVTADQSRLYTLAFDLRNGETYIQRFDGRNVERILTLTLGSNKNWRFLGPGAESCYLQENELVQIGNSAGNQFRNDSRIIRLGADSVTILGTTFRWIVTGSWTVLNGDGYFFATTNSDLDLFRVGSTDQDASRVVAALSGQSLTVISDRLYFANGPSLYISDGTEAGTKVLLTDPGYFFAPVFAAYQQQVYILDRNRIYRTAGAPESTTLLLQPGENSGRFSSPTVIEPAAAAGLPGIFVRRTHGETTDLYRFDTRRTIDTDLSGSWVSEGLNDQGLLLQAGQRDDDTRFLFAVWFFYEDGNPSWLAGVSDFGFGQESITVEMVRTSGLGLLEIDEQRFADSESLGDITLRVDGCEQLLLDYQLGELGAGSLSIEQLVATVDKGFCAAW